VEVLLRFLARDKGVLVYDSSTVKFLAQNETQGITQEDETIAALKTLIQDMESQIKVLEGRVEKLGETAKEAVARKNRLSALSALRSKKLAESTLGKRQATLAQLEEVFMKIEQAADQVELVRVMDASAKVLGSLNKQVGGVERVEGVVDRLREEMEKTDEVGMVVGEMGRENGVDEGEVDDELELMEREERERREAIERTEKEAKEKREAEETKRKLDALEAVEREAREKETVRKQAEAATEKEIEESTMGMKRISLDPPNAEMA
jgi:charged multivesicular body protein 7